MPRKNPLATKAIREETYESVMAISGKNSNHSKTSWEFLTIGLLSCGLDFESILRMQEG